MISYIYMDRSGHKKARPVKNRKDYFAIRNTEANVRNFNLAREGNKNAKMNLKQFNYNDLLPNGVLKGCCHSASTFAHDIDCGDETECRKIAQTLLEKKEEIGLLELSVSSGWGLHAVCRREQGKTILENQVRLSTATQTEMDTSAHDMQRVMFTGPATEDVLLYLDDAIFTESLSVEESAAEFARLKEREKQGQEEVPAGAKKANKHYRPWEEKMDDGRRKMDDVLPSARTKCEEQSMKNVSPQTSDIIHQTSIVDERIRFIAKGVMKEKNLLESDFLDEGGRHTTVKMFLSGATQLLKKDETNGVLKELMPDHWDDENIQTLVEDFYQNYTNPNQRLLRYQENLFTQSRRLGKENNDNDDENDNDYDDEEENQKDEVAAMPPAPPVIRELISIAPKDFVVPAIGALMPILGTLTSYVRAEDKQDNKTISTTFFSIIYAPPSSGKSFVERYIDYLLRDLLRRDELNDARDDVYARMELQKSQSEHGEPLPLTTIRIMEAKNSETEFLQKQRNNRGHHMFTYCSEIDQWRKGVKAAGGNKDDMIRIAWDNGRYGQKFKSPNSFKGKVNLYWNVLIAGTDDQLQAYFKNVTNGLVTRCCFQEILNQEFQENPPLWKTLNKKDRKVIDSFIEKCDRMTYSEPLTYDVEQCYSVADKDFDAEVPWRMDFKPLINANIDWIIPTIVRFNREHCREATIDHDKAHDTFRRRVGTRGKRLALLCTQLYEKPMTPADKRACAKWIAWWMEQDIKGIMRPFANKYMKAIEESVPDNTPRRTLFERLPEEFSNDEVRRTADILGYSSTVKQIVSNWTKVNVIEKIAKNRWRKIGNK